MRGSFGDVKRKQLSKERGVVLAFLPNTTTFEIVS